MTVSKASRKMSRMGIACMQLNAGQRVCSHDNNTHSKVVTLATVCHWLLRYNTARYECDMSSRWDEWHANYKQDDVTNPLIFLLSHFFNTNSISHQMAYRRTKLNQPFGDWWNQSKFSLFGCVASHILECSDTQSWPS